MDKKNYTIPVLVTVEADSAEEAYAKVVGTLQADPRVSNYTTCDRWREETEDKQCTLSREVTARARAWYWTPEARRMHS